MRKYALMCMMATLSLTACKESFKTAEDGMEYKIITDGKGQKVEYGNFMQLQMVQYYQTGTEDSVLSDSRTSGRGSMFTILDSVSAPKAFYNILSQLRMGDSLVMRELTDSAFKDLPQGMPPMFKKGHYMIYTMKVENIFKTREEADSARMLAMEKANEYAAELARVQLEKDDQILQEYLKKNNINAVKSPKGVYVEMIKEGTGPKIEMGTVAKVNYTGTTLDGVMFDSNTDPSKGHVTPLPLNYTNDPSLGSNVIDGWKDGGLMLREGSVAKFYIPSPLAYGTRGAGGDIKPNEILIFDIEILDVLNEAEAKVLAEADAKKMEELQRKYFDSLQKANPQLTPVQ